MTDHQAAWYNGYHKGHADGVRDTLIVIGLAVLAVAGIWYAVRRHNEKKAEKLAQQEQQLSAYPNYF